MRTMVAAIAPHQAATSLGETWRIESVSLPSQDGIIPSV